MSERIIHLHDPGIEASNRMDAMDSLANAITILFPEELYPEESEEAKLADSISNAICNYYTRDDIAIHELPIFAEERVGIIITHCIDRLVDNESPGALAEIDRLERDIQQLKRGTKRKRVTAAHKGLRLIRS